MFDPAETDRYHQRVGRLNRRQQDAYLADLGRMFQLRPGLSVLDAGAGTGTLCAILLRQSGLSVTALWQGGWEEEGVDVLPLSTCQSTAVVPYLLEVAGFRIDAVQGIESVNELPTTRTPRYVVVASK